MNPSEGDRAIERAVRASSTTRPWRVGIAVKRRAFRALQCREIEKARELGEYR